MHELLATDDINSEDLETLLKAREEGKADFLLIDVREGMEYDMGKPGDWNKRHKHSYPGLLWIDFL